MPAVESARMKILCHCGATILDQTDALPHKAHVIPDQVWFDLLDEIDVRVIDSLAAGRLDAESAKMQVRILIGDARRSAYECTACGRLFVSGQDHQLHCYEPRDGSPGQGILRAR